MPEEPKLIIDTDWKSQAQAEKERLAAKAAPKPGVAPGGAGAGAPGADDPVRFEEIIRMFSIQALSYLGEVPDPRTGQRIFAPEYAKLYIDMLGVLEEKTKGNLTPEEQNLLTGALGDLRLTYVEMGRAVAKAVQEGKIKPGGGMGQGGVGGAGVVAPGGPVGGPVGGPAGGPGGASGGGAPRP